MHVKLLLVYYFHILLFSNVFILKKKAKTQTQIMLKKVMEVEVKKALTSVLERVSAAAKARNPVSVLNKSWRCAGSQEKGMTRPGAR